MPVTFDEKVETFLKSLGAIIQYYAKRDFCVVVIFGDNQFKCLSEDLMQIYQNVLNTCVANEHNSIIERGNRTFNKMLWCTFASIPFLRIPDFLTAELIYSCTFWINCHRFKVGVSQTISLCELLTGIKFDYSIYGKFQFSDYVQAYCGTANTTHERSNDYMYT